MRCVRRTARSSRALITCGQLASERPKASSRTASRTGMSTCQLHPVAARARPRAARATAGRTSPSPSSSVAVLPASIRSRASSPSSTRKPSRPRAPSSARHLPVPGRQLEDAAPRARCARARDLGRRDPQAQLRVQLENSCTVRCGRARLPPFRCAQDATTRGVGNQRWIPTPPLLQGEVRDVASAAFG